MGGPSFQQVAESSSNFRWLIKNIFLLFWAMRLRVCVNYMFKFGAGELRVAGAHNTNLRFAFGYVTLMLV